MCLLRLKDTVQAKVYHLQSESPMRCALALDRDVDELYRLLELEDFNSTRATCTIEKTDTIDITIDADDPTALKAIINSILNVIRTYDKAK